MRNRLLIVGLVAVGFGCGGTDEGGDHVNPSGAPTTAKTPTEKEEVTDVVVVGWARLRHVDRAESSWADCRAKTVGFDEIRSCADKTAAAVAETHNTMNSVPMGTPCGQETVKKFVRYAGRRAEFTKSVVDWLTRNEPTLRPMLAKRSIADAKPSGYPSDPDNSLGLAGAANLECMAQILGCGQTCSVDQMNKAAGIPDAPALKRLGWHTYPMPGNGRPDSADAREEYMRQVLTAASDEPSLDKKAAAPLLERVRLAMVKNTSVSPESIKASLGDDSASITVADGVHARLAIKGEDRSFGACSEIFIGTAMASANVTPDDFAKVGMRGLLCKSTGCAAVFDMRPTSKGGGLYGGSSCLSLADAKRLSAQ